MPTVLNATFVVLLIAISGFPAERLASYDDFNATHLNPDKWFGGEYSPAFPSANAEAIRQLQDQRLRLLYRSYGPTDADSGRLRSELVLMFRHPTAVTAIQATVEVTDVATAWCPNNPEPTVAWAALGGRFFGTAAATPEGEVRDMVALIGIIRVSNAPGPPDGLQAWAMVYYCANRPCTDGMELHRRDLGSVQRGERVRLRVQWDRDQHRFIFQRDEGSEVVAPYAVTDTAPPSIAVKLLDALMLVPRCTVMPRPMAFIDARFDDVMVNASAASRIER